MISGVDVFGVLYQAVGWGAVMRFLELPLVARLAAPVYDFWARRRMAIAGRPSLAEVIEARRMRQARPAWGEGAASREAAALRG